MPQFRKKPLYIYAEQWRKGDQHPGVYDPSGASPYVITIHEHRTPVADGDWIVPEHKPDRYYPIKPDVFDATYSPINVGDDAYYSTQLKELRHGAKSVYLACEEGVAADISQMLSRAADTIELLVPQGANKGP